MPRIDSTFFGGIIINGRKHETDVVISTRGEVAVRERTHLFSKNEIQELLLEEPDVIIVGTGNSSLMKVDPAAEVAARLEGVELLAKNTQQAVQDYNRLSKTKKVAAVMHITC